MKHCINKMPPQATLYLSSTRARIVDGIFRHYFAIFIRTQNRQRPQYCYHMCGFSSKQ